MACKGFDEQVVRQDAQLADLMEQFVRVRIIQTNGMDLSLFQFDFDLTFAAFFMNADKTIYGRYGSRSDQVEATRDISIEAFREATEAALELHRAYPANKASLTGKKGPSPKFDVPEAYPSLRGKYTARLDYEGKVAGSCIHCHMIGAAERNVYRTANQAMSDAVLYPWPMPDVVGLKLSAKEKAKVSKVVAGSSAEADGFRRGDEILTLAGQPMISIADVQWVLHTAKAPTTLKAEVLRHGEKIDLALTLKSGWRRAGDISWRTTTWDLRRMALGGLILEDLAAADRENAGLTDAALALRVKGLGQHGAHAVARNAGFQKDDILVDFDGQTHHMTETGVIVHALRSRMPETQVPVTVLRDGERVNLKLPMQ